LKGEIGRGGKREQIQKTKGGRKLESRTLQSADPEKNGRQLSIILRKTNRGGRGGRDGRCSKTFQCIELGGNRYRTKERLVGGIKVLVVAGGRKRKNKVTREKRGLCRHPAGKRMARGREGGEGTTSYSKEGRQRNQRGKNASFHAGKKRQEGERPKSRLGKVYLSSFGERWGTPEGREKPKGYFRSKRSPIRSSSLKGKRRTETLGSGKPGTWNALSPLGQKKKRKKSGGEPGTCCPQTSTERGPGPGRGAKG